MAIYALHYLDQINASANNARPSTWQPNTGFVFMGAPGDPVRFSRADGTAANPPD